MSHKKVPTFENSMHQEYFMDLSNSNISWKLEDQSFYAIFLALVPAPEV